MRKKSKKKSQRGRIIKDSDEFIEYKGDNSVFHDVPNSKSHPKGRGIYALYDNYGLYYVGLTTFSLYSRLRSHTNDHHKGKWKRFSWYQIPNLKYSKDMETAILRIVNPKANRVKGKIGRKRTKRRTKK